MTATPCRAVHWSRGALFWNDKQVKHFEKMQILALKPLTSEGRRTKHSNKVISTWCHHPNREERKHHSSPKAKPEIEKTIRHVEARLTTGVNTRGCVKLPLRARRGLIGKYAAIAYYLSMCGFFTLTFWWGRDRKSLWLWELCCVKWSWGQRATEDGSEHFSLDFYLHSSLCCHKIFASSVCCWWLLAWLSPLAAPPPLQHSPGISFS